MKGRANTVLSMPKKGQKGWFSLSVDGWHVSTTWGILHKIERNEHSPIHVAIDGENEVAVAFFHVDRIRIHPWTLRGGDEHGTDKPA